VLTFLLNIFWILPVSLGSIACAKRGVIRVFAASAFSPKERVNFRDGTSITLVEYAARRSLQLITASDFNLKLREKGCPKDVSVQRICKLAGNEKDVRSALDAIW
jgi:hypothetical protein